MCGDFDKCSKFLYNTIFKNNFDSRWPFPWASCQIPIIANCACAGNAGNVFPHHRGLAIPTCITARASRTCRDACRDRWLAVPFEVGGGENVPGILGACATRNFTYLVKGPCMEHFVGFLFCFVVSVVAVGFTKCYTSNETFISHCLGVRTWNNGMRSLSCYVLIHLPWRLKYPKG